MSVALEVDDRLVVRRLALQMRIAGVALLALGLPVSAAPRIPRAEPAPIVMLPGSAVLTGPNGGQRFLVEARGESGYSGDLTARARFESSNPRVAAVDAGGEVRAVGDGRATITATIGARTARAGVLVQGTRRASVRSFANDVQPVLTKSGCNSGACHGASAGKGGLKLSLRGYDSISDYNVLTRQALGRRIVPTDPGRSLLLQKPAMQVTHGGGMRFKPRSPEYAIIEEWIRAGCPQPAERDPKVDRLEVFPAAATLKPRQEQQVLVRAVFTDGRTEDVTRWVKYGSGDTGVADVDDGGKITVKGPGEAAVTMFYQSRVAFARVISPYPTAVSPAVFERADRRSFIDDLVLRKLKTLRIAPSGPITDEEFIRRAFLDAAGILPTAGEVEAFLADSAAEKQSGASEQGRGARARLIDRLLERPEFVDYWAYKWSDLLLISSRRLPPKGMWAFYNWTRESVAQNKPWDRFVREIVTASGSTVANGATNYYVLHKDPIDLTETTSQAFLGMSITCARCHNHPLEKWTQDEYYGLVNLFGRVRLKNGEGTGETLVFAAESGDVTHPRHGVPMPPKPLDAPAISLDAPEDRRTVLADWLTSPKNPYFSRALVNRVWRNFMGRGLVEAEDDLRLTNPPSNDVLLAALAADFAAPPAGRVAFDVKNLVRTIMNSAAYQRSSTPLAGSPPDQKYYSTYIPRRLSAEVLLDVISQVTGVPTEFPGYARGTRALQLADSQVASYFLTAFGRPDRVQTCSCERQEEPSVAQALHLSNGDTINAKLRAAGGTVEALAKERLDDEQVLDRLYVAAFSRKPTSAERARVLGALKQIPPDGTARRDAIEDLLAAMLTTKEFLFNH